MHDGVPLSLGDVAGLLEYNNSHVVCSHEEYNGTTQVDS